MDTTTQPENDGGPAFPHERQIRCNGEVIDHELMPGMSLRDWFAGQALAGALANTMAAGTMEAIAADAYLQADIMLAERAKGRT